jgi:hypothetical protein
MRTEGSAVLLNARIVPKSVSAETIVRPSPTATSKISSSVAAVRRVLLQLASGQRPARARYLRETANRERGLKRAGSPAP